MAKEAAETFGEPVKLFFSGSLKRAWAAMSPVNRLDKQNTVSIGDVYNIGIGHGDAVDATVIKIEADSINGDTAHLRMLDFGGPIQTESVAYLATQQKINR